MVVPTVSTGASKLSKGAVKSLMVDLLDPKQNIRLGITNWPERAHSTSAQITSMPDSSNWKLERVSDRIPFSLDFSQQPDHC